MDGVGGTIQYMVTFEQSIKCQKSYTKLWKFDWKTELGNRSQQSKLEKRRRDIEKREKSKIA